MVSNGAQIEQEKWELPARFALTEEKLAEIDAQQKVWASQATSPFAHRSPADVARSRAVKAAEHLEFALRHVNAQIGEAIAGNGGDLAALVEARSALSHRLAENYATYGRYDLAAKVEPQREYRDHYVSILEAIWRNDDEVCDCPDHQASGESNLTVTQSFVKAEIFSVKHGRVMPLVACNGCPHMNVTEMPAELVAQRAHRARAAQMVADRTPASAAVELSRAGHTSEKLLAK